MSVYRCRIKSLHIIKCNRRINQKSKYTCPDKIPECNSDKAVNGPPICFKPGCTPAELNIVPRFKTHKNHRNYLECTESCTKRHNSNRSTSEIEMMKCTKYAT